MKNFFIVIKKLLRITFSFVFGFLLAFFVLTIICGFAGLLDGSETMLGIASISILVFSIAFGVFVAIHKPKKKAAQDNAGTIDETNKCEQPEEIQVAVEDEVEKQEHSEIENKEDAEKPCEKVNTYKVAGVTNYEKNILSFSWENHIYSMTKNELIEEDHTNERIWKYRFRKPKIELVPEPDNKYDENAIKVMAGEKHIGYIKSDECVHLLDCIKENRIINIDCKLGGGPYKFVYEEYDSQKEKFIYTLERDCINVFVHLFITERT